MLESGTGLAMIVIALRFLDRAWLLDFTLERLAFALMAWWFVARAAIGFSGRCGQVLAHV
jgi:hypothetical protein